MIAFRPPAQPAPAPPPPSPPGPPPAPPTIAEPDDAALAAIAIEAIDDRCARIADLLARSAGSPAENLRWRWLRLRQERAALAAKEPYAAA